MIEKIPIFTPIVSELYPALTCASRYLGLCNQFGARVISPIELDAGSTICDKIEIEETSLSIALKISSMILSVGILPLIAIFVTIVYRSREDFRWKVEERTIELRALPEVDLIQAHFDRLEQERARAQKNVEDLKQQLADQVAEKIQEEAKKVERLRKVEEEFKKEQALEDLRLKATVTALGKLI